MYVAENIDSKSKINTNYIDLSLTKVADLSK